MKADQDSKGCLLKLLGPVRRTDVAELSGSWNYGESPGCCPLGVGRLCGVTKEAVR